MKFCSVNSINFQFLICSLNQILLNVLQHLLHAELEPLLRGVYFDFQLLNEVEDLERGADFETREINDLILGESEQRFAIDLALAEVIAIGSAIVDAQKLRHVVNVPLGWREFARVRALWQTGR